MIVISNVQSSYTGTIEFSGISSEAYRKLMEFVNGLNGETKEEAPVAPVETKEEEKPNDSEMISKSRTKSAESGSEVFNRCKDEIKSIWDYAKGHPDEYEIRFCEAQEFYEENKDKFDGISIITLGHAANALGFERKRQMVNGQPRRVRAYPMKRQTDKALEEKKTRGRPRRTPVFSEDTENQSESIGQFLKKARKDAGLSVYELSNILEYPYYAIQGWEAESSVPSQEAIKVLAAKVSPDFKRYLTA